MTTLPQLSHIVSGHALASLFGRRSALICCWGGRSARGSVTPWRNWTSAAWPIWV
jgi:hypothetical protein